MRAIFNTVPFGAGIEIFGTARVVEASTLAMFSYGSGYLIGSVIPGKPPHIKRTLYSAKDID